MEAPIAVSDTPKTRVFITNFSGHDYSSAEQFGEFVCITRGFVSFKNFDRLKYTIAEAIAQSSPDDYLLISGRGTVCSLCCLIWLATHKRVKLLLFSESAQEKKYHEVEITMSHLEKLVDVIKGV